jgi:hypothetical protein
MTILTKVGELPALIMLKAVREVEAVDWGEVDSSERKSISYFSHCDSLALRIPDAEGVPFDQLPTVLTARDTQVREKFKALNAIITWLYYKVKGKELGRVSLIRLLAGKVINQHIDFGAYYQHYQRFHVPLITNPQVLFTGEHESLHLPVGHVYRLDNLQMHGVRNDSEQDRVHLVVDIRCTK